MANYYFVAASLPPIVLGEKPEISFEGLCDRLQVNLSKKDLEKVRVLRRFIDLENIRQLFLERPIDQRGNLTEKELDEALLIRDFLPQYALDFLDQFEQKKEKLRHFFGLLSRYFQEEIPEKEGFLKRYLTFERNLRLVLVGLRVKKRDVNLAFQLQFEDVTDPIVASILAQKDASDFDPPQEFVDLKERLRACGEDLWQQFQTLSHYRFEKIEELSGNLLFSIDWILSYVAQLIIAEKWSGLDEVRGRSHLAKYKTG